MRRRTVWTMFLAALSLTAARAESPWAQAKSEHFEVFSQAGEASARSILLEFERLRAFFLEQTTLTPGQSAPVRVMAFASAKAYEPYRLRATADAYYVGTESRDYIVMALPAGDRFGIAAHEYAHLVLHATGIHLPAWLNEGLAEFYSSFRISDGAAELGAEPPGRVRVLQHRAWMPLSDLASLDLSTSPNRSSAELFYAESWALTEMLLRSPEYAARFHEFLVAVRGGVPSLQVFQQLYGKSADVVTRDLESWTAQRVVAPIRLGEVDIGTIGIEASEAAPLVVQAALAEVLLAAGELDRAEALYRDIARQSPEGADVLAALGTIALRRGDTAKARLEWKDAIDHGVANAGLCYRYALLAEQAGLPSGEIRAALERAVTLAPNFDDARYHLALLEKNAGDYEAAVASLRAMRKIDSARAYAYWVAMADSLNELGRREEAIAAARHAEEHAGSESERANAAQLAYIAQTDLQVQFARDANGQAQMVTTRAPHQAANWNPFIEAGDDLRRVQGTLKEIDCSGPATRFIVKSANGLLKLVIVDPARVQMRNAPSEFVCGPQEPSVVNVEYAAIQGGDGVVRGMEFKQPARAHRAGP